MITKIKVTQKDINNGRPKNPAFCPVALALQREIPDVKFSVVGPIKREVDSGELHYWRIRNVIHFVQDFDSKREVKPFTFSFDPDIPEIRYTRQSP